MRLPGLTNFDLTLAKNTQITERLRMQIRGQFFNAFNHPQWNGVALNFNNAIFGRVTSAHDPRIMQIADRIEVQLLSTRATAKPSCQYEPRH